MRVTKVNKVHKTGRFTLINDARQWSPYKDNDNTWSALAPGPGWDRPRLELVTPGLLKEQSDFECKKEFGRLAELASKLRERATPDLLARLADIVAMLETPP